MVPVTIMPVRPAMAASCMLRLNCSFWAMAATRYTWDCQAITAAQTTTSAMPIVTCNWAQILNLAEVGMNGSSRGWLRILSALPGEAQGIASDTLGYSQRRQALKGIKERYAVATWDCRKRHKGSSPQNPTLKRIQALGDRSVPNRWPGPSRMSCSAAW